MRMSYKRQIAWTLLFAPGMFLLGLVSGLFLQAVPACTGAVFALLVGGGLFVGPILAAGGALGFAGGFALSTLAVGDMLWPLGLWLLPPLLVLPPALLLAMRRKAPLWRLMVDSGVAVLVYGAVSYIAANLILGDPVAHVVDYFSESLRTLQEGAPALYDLVLSLLSGLGLLSGEGLTAGAALDETTRAQLTAELLEMYDLSLRLNLIDTLAKQALHIGFLAPLLPLMAASRAGRAEEFTALPDFARVRIPVKLNLALMGAVVAMWILLLFSSSAYALYMAVWSAVRFVYAVQGLSLIEWFGKKHGWPRGVRLLLQAVGLVLLQTVLFLLGFLEQIFYFRKIGRPTPRDFGLREKDDEDDGDAP